MYNVLVLEIRGRSTKNLLVLGISISISIRFIYVLRLRCLDNTLGYNMIISRSYAGAGDGDGDVPQGGGGAVWLVFSNHLSGEGRVVGNW